MGRRTHAYETMAPASGHETVGTEPDEYYRGIEPIGFLDLCCCPSLDEVKADCMAFIVTADLCPCAIWRRMIDM